jgi:hypothetical protein
MSENKWWTTESTTTTKQPELHARFEHLSLFIFTADFHVAEMLMNSLISWRKKQ